MKNPLIVLACLSPACRWYPSRQVRRRQQKLYDRLNQALRRRVARGAAWWIDYDNWAKTVRQAIDARIDQALIDQAVDVVMGLDHYGGICVPYWPMTDKDQAGC